MPQMCFSYPANLPLSVRNRDAMPRALRDLGGVPGYPCFAYPVDLPLGVRNRDAAQPTPPGLRRMPQTCFSY